jgi:hypothetical protein
VDFSHDAIRLLISRAGVVDPLVFAADINAILAESVSVQLILPTGANSSRQVGIATGISCPPSGLGSEEAPGACGVFQE